jgi:hypothetical protein
MSALSLAVRLASAADAVPITDVINAAYLVERFFVDGPRISQTQVVELMAKGRFLVGEGDGTVIASVYVEPRASSAYLGLLSVDPHRQGQGAGHGNARCR